MKKNSSDKNQEINKSTKIKRRTVLEIAAQKNNAPLVVLTAYTTPMARILDRHVDILLVGDSLGMVLYGFDSTLPVTMEMMIAHGAAVRRGAAQSLVVVDMPFGSYQQSKQQAFASAARIMKETGCDAVKLEGGTEMAETIEFLTMRGIPVMAHIGVKPQHVNMQGGYRYKGRNEEEASEIMADALAVQRAGAFCVVIEAVKKSLAARISAELSIPTIGIGASVACDGQVLVAEDMLGLSLSENLPRFVKQYCDLAKIIDNAAQSYAKEVRLKKFPEDKHSY